MAQVYKKLEIDVNKEVTAIITAVQNDASSRYLDIVLLDGSTAINLTEHEVRIYGKKYDGTEIYNDGEITEAANGRCQFELTSQALAVAQDLEVQIILFKNNVEVLSTQPFKIHVVKSLFSKNAIESSNEYGALVVLYQNLYEAYDLMTTMVQNIGVPGEIAEQLTIDTMWDAWEYLCNYVSVDLTTLIQNALNNNSVDGVMQRIGETNDTGATESTGTVYAKLNALIARDKHKSFKYLETSFGTNQTDVTVLSVTGAGEFYGICGKIKDVKVIIDDTEFYNQGGLDNWFYYGGRLREGFGVLSDGSSRFYDTSIDSMPFKNSLVIKGSSDATHSMETDITYAMYE